jgi:hypothetical protein
MLSPEEIEPLVRMVRLRGERVTAYEAQRVAVKDLERQLIEAREAIAPLWSAMDECDIALAELKKHLVAVGGGASFDETSACRTALQFAPQVAPELVDALTKQLAEREASAVEEPAPDVDVAEILAAVERLTKQGGA